MFRIRAVGALLMSAGVLVGCGTSGPKASTEMPTDQQTAAALQRSWESTHPGSKAGVVDAVLPARRYVSVAGLPLDEIQKDTVVSILDQRQRIIVSGVVIDKQSGRLQVNYEAVPGGERDPRIGDLVVWFPSGQAVPPEPVQPGANPSAEVPATQPAENMPRENPATQPANIPPVENPPPATQPAGNPAAPATQPAGGTTSNANEPANASGTTGNTGTTGANQQVPDVNK